MFLLKALEQGEVAVAVASGVPYILAGLNKVHCLPLQQFYSHLAHTTQYISQPLEDAVEREMDAPVHTVPQLPQILLVMAEEGVVVHHHDDDGDVFQYT